MCRPCISLFKRIIVLLKLVRTLTHFVNSTVHQFLAINESDKILYNIILRICLIMTICLVSLIEKGEIKQNKQFETLVFPEGLFYIPKRYSNKCSPIKLRLS